MQMKIGDVVRETKHNDIGTVIGVPSEKVPHYIVRFDASGKVPYTEAQVASGALRMLTPVTL